MQKYLYSYSAAIGIRANAVRLEPPRPIVFRLDHPFLVVIVDDFNKLPLFIARVTDPAAS